MKNIRNFFKRHLIAAPIGFGSFLFFIFGTSLTFLPTIALPFVVYFGSIFVIKQYQISTNLKQLGMPRSEYNYIRQQLKSAQVKLKRLNSYYGKVRSVQAFRQLHEMNTLSRRIIGIIKDNPKKFYHVENFFYAHLDSAVELTSKYSILVNQPLKDKEIQIALQNTRETLTHVNEQLEQDLRSALTSDIETLRMEIDFVDISRNKDKQLLEMKGETDHDRNE